MGRSLKNISKLLLVAGCVSVLASNITSATPLEYDMEQPKIRTDVSSPSKIKLEGDVRFDHAIGEKINLSLRNTDVQQVLRMFADKAGLNIVFHSSAQGTVTLDLVDVSLEDAFKMVMKMTNLTYVIKDKTMMVVSTSSAETINLTKDNIAILPVKYADAAYLAHFLNTNVFSLNSPGLSYGPIVTTNSERNELLIFGTENDYLMAKKIVERFDKKPIMTTYRVNHTTPFEMAKMVCETLFNLPASGSTTSSGAGVGNSTSKLDAKFQMQSAATKSVAGETLGGGTIACTVQSGVSTGNISSYQAKPTLNIYVQPELGTLTMVGGSEQQIQMVNDFILENDRKQPQAILEMSIISLTESGSKEFSNTWEYTSKHLNLYFDAGKTSTSVLEEDDSGNLVPVPSPIYWKGSTVGNSQGLKHTINMLIQNNKARMLANPKIVLTNGQQSVIDLTQDYIETTTVQFLNNSSSGGTGTIAAVQKTYSIGEDNGIKVEITPFISPDGYVSLTIKPEYSSPLEHIKEKDAATGEYYIAATLLQRHNLDLKNVRIKDEETLVLGGMITETESNKVGKVPILGDLPIIGALFRSNSKTTDKSELIFTLTPRIIKDSEDVAEL